MSQSRLTSTKISRRSNVNRHLDGLKGELDLMTQEIESLRKERDRYKAKVEAQAKELRDVRRNLTQIITSSQVKTPRKAISASRPFPKSSNSPEKQSRPGISQVNPSQPLKTLKGGLQVQRTTRRSTQRATLIRGCHYVATPTQPSESHTMTKALDPIVAHSQIVSPPQPSPSTVLPREHNRSIIFNNEVKREFDVEVTHVLFHGDTIDVVKFSRDGKYLAAGCRNGKAYIYDAERGSLVCILRNLLAEEDSTTAVCFSQDGKYLATTSLDKNIYIWEIKTKYVRNAFKGHTHLINTLDFSPDGSSLVSASDDKTVRLWNMHDGAVRVLTDGNPDIGYFLSAVFSPDGMYVAASDADGMVRIWDARAGQLVRRMKSHVDWVFDVVFMPDGKGLVSGSYDLRLKYWDVSSLWTTPFRAGLQTVDDSHGHFPEREFLGHTGVVYSLSISPDGRWVASSSRDRSVRIWDTRNAAMQCILNHDSMVFTADFSPAGGLLASGDHSGALTIWRYSDITG